MVCTIYEAVCEPKTADPFGEVLGGFIKLGVILIPANIGTEAQGRSMQDTDDAMAWTLSYVEDGTRVLYCFPDCWLEDDNLEIGDRVYCAPILEDLSKSGSTRGCLVLKHLQGQEYQRIGFCALEKENLSPDQSLLAVNNTSNPDLTAPEYAQKVESYSLHYNRDADIRITII